MTNFDNLPQNIVESRLREAKQLLNEQKGSYQVLSGNNLRYYRVEKTFDVFKTTADPIVLIATLTSIDVITPLADMIVELSTSSDGTNWVGQPNYVEPGTPSYYVFDLRGAVFEPKVSKWGIRISDVPANTWIRLQLQFLADGAGTA
ncbi:hypothetical protein [Arthrobacter sp. V1I9]|uniref:hypothetical protein n=1 Tax=Arthrobacter sp. V1I9 TaxID=3042275 RepID=UPI0027D8E298|nr:hypothetical protein [Arthrobacter sp. V1I9]